MAEEIWFKPKSARSLKEWKQLHGRLAEYDHSKAKLITHKFRMKTREKHKSFKLSLLQRMNTRDSQPVKTPSLIGTARKPASILSKAVSGIREQRLTRTIQIFVKTPLNTTLCLQLDKKTTIKSLQVQVADEIGIAANQIKLTARNNFQLCELLSLEDHGINDDDNMYVTTVEGLRGGADKPPEEAKKDKTSIKEPEILSTQSELSDTSNNDSETKTSNHSKTEADRSTLEIEGAFEEASGITEISATQPELSIETETSIPTKTKTDELSLEIKEAGKECPGIEVHDVSEISSTPPELSDTSENGSESETSKNSKTKADDVALEREIGEEALEIEEIPVFRFCFLIPVVNHFENIKHIVLKISSMSDEKEYELKQRIISPKCGGHTIKKWICAEKNIQMHSKTPSEFRYVISREGEGDIETSVRKVSDTSNHMYRSIFPASLPQREISLQTGRLIHMDFILNDFHDVKYLADVVEEIIDACFLMKTWATLQAQNVFVNWMKEKIADSRTQSLYLICLAILLGKLLGNTDSESFPSIGKESAQKMLRVLGECKLSTSVNRYSECIERTFLWLINEVNGSWLDAVIYSIALLESRTLHVFEGKKLKIITNDAFKESGDAFFDKIRQFAPKEEEAFICALVKKVKSPYIVISVADKCSLSSVPGQGLILAILEFPYGELELEEIVKNPRFWKNVFTWSQEDKKKSISSKEHSALQKILQNLQILIQSVKDKNITIRHPICKIVESQNQKENLIDLLEHISSSEKDTILTYLNEVDELKRLHTQTHSALTKFQDSTSKLRHEFLLSEHIEIAKQFVDSYESLSFVVRQNIETHLEHYMIELIATAKIIEEMVDSRIFENVSRTILNNKTKDLETEGKFRKLPLEKYLGALKQECFAKYMELCRGLLSKDLEMNLETLQMLMNGIDKCESLEKELVVIERHQGKSFPQIVKNRLKDFIKLKNCEQKNRDLRAALINIHKKSDRQEENTTICEENKKVCFSDWLGDIDQLKTTMNINISFPESIREECWDILQEIAHSQSLMVFLREIKEEDLSNVIGVLGKFSSEWLQLMDLKCYMTPFFKQENANIDNLTALLIKESPRGIKDKISQLILKCNKNLPILKGIYKSTATHGERDLYIMKAAFEHSGEFCFTEDENKCDHEITLKYPMETPGEHGICTDDELNDIRNRALLLCSYELQGKQDEQKCITSDAAKFIESVNRAYRIAELYSELNEAAGFLSGVPFGKPVHPNELHSIEHILITERSKFRESLVNARKQHFCLNYFSTRQLWSLDEFLCNKIELNENIKVLLHFICPHANLEKGVKFRFNLPNDNCDYYTRLEHIAKALETFCYENTQRSNRITKIDQCAQTVDSTVQPGEIFFARYPEESPSIENILTLMTLCYNTTGTYPNPSEILFCHHDTTKEEISRILARCQDSVRNNLKKRLYIIVDVDKLSVDVQVGLIREIKEFQNSLDRDYQLAVLCRGNRYHHILQEFPSFIIHQVTTITKEDLMCIIQTDRPSVEIVTSEYSGLGKTTYIHQESKVYNRNDIKSVLVEGPATKLGLVTYIKEIAKDVSQTDFLHLDITVLEDPTLLDNMIFELLVVGMITVGDTFLKWYGQRVFLEVANSLNNVLYESLTICRMFKMKIIEWQNFDNLNISHDPRSPLQIVCRYKKTLDESLLDKQELDVTCHCDLASRHVCGQNLTTEDCQTVLRKIFDGRNKLSYTVVHSFIDILACGLKQFSCSSFFSINNLQFALQRRGMFLPLLGGRTLDIRSNLVDILFTSTVEVTAGQRRISSLHREGQSRRTPSRFLTATDVENRMKEIVSWENGNHELVVFNRQDKETVTLLYRNVVHVPSTVNHYFELQTDPLPDYDKMGEDELRLTLHRICRSSDQPFNNEYMKNLEQRYVLTPDNILKMIVIIKRINARVPVVIQGETGCGKTMLITYLASICEVSLKVIHIHAGTSREEITDFVNGVLKLSAAGSSVDKKEIWAFFDEINTCSYLGLLNEIICHRRFMGTHLPDNVICLAACNPYRKRVKDSLNNVALARDDDDSKGYVDQLVYRVHPLPETMMDFIWDFGSLDKKDEKIYIQRMVKGSVEKKIESVFVTLLAESQEFIRKHETTSFCVSLRDVNRCIRLASWMTKTLLENKGEAPVPPKWQQMTGCNNKYFRGMILALAFCYHSRLAHSMDRSNYRKLIATKCQSYYLDEPYIRYVIEAEQEHLLNSMKLPDGIAQNDALKENVFILLGAIMNKIPVFVVGKPGCSKSLSVNITESNLKGMQSKCELFKLFPAIIKLSFQGTESSTSDGIKKVFDTAEQYKEEGRYPVVLLDEIGLAERSPFNPLKVLHSLLDPDKTGCTSVSVIGISNWRLDAAKMNRAVLLSRPDPTFDDLVKTAEKIRDEIVKNEGQASTRIQVEDLKQLVEGYYEYKKYHTDSNIRNNFHGLRDFYAVIKYITTRKYVAGIVERGIRRNFGGLKQHETSDALNKIMLNSNILQSAEKGTRVVDLINECIEDEESRHLMIVTKHGESALNILSQILDKREHILLCGSKFENDISEEYDHLLLSKIIFHMEKKCILVLRGLEKIYGALYDMFNQNYKEKDQSKICSVALGANSLHNCVVHSGFKCIVLVEEQDIEDGRCDPPFLNRFEKQRVTFADVLSDFQYTAVMNLRQRVDGITRVHKHQWQFTSTHSLLGFNDDTLPSLVLKNSQAILTSNKKDKENKVMHQCMIDILKLASSDAVLRLSKSEFAKTNTRKSVSFSIEDMQRQYFEFPLHKGIEFFMRSISDRTAMSLFTEEAKQAGLKLVLYTFSSFHVDLNKILKSTETSSEHLTFQIERIIGFRSESHLHEKFRNFWVHSKTKMLIIQCHASADAPHVLNVKCLIDQYRQEYNKSKTFKEKGPKNVCFVIHINRAVQHDKSRQPWMFNFLGGWEPFSLETLEAHKYAITCLGGTSVLQLVENDISDIVKEELLWCFSCITYTSHARMVTEIFSLIKIISQNKRVLDGLRQKIVYLIQKIHKEKGAILGTFKPWEVDVACNLKVLGDYSTLAEARRQHIKRYIREEVAKVIYKIEELDSWSCLISNDGETPQRIFDLWIDYFTNERVFAFHLMDISAPHGVESYQIEQQLLRLKFPFFMIFHKEIQVHRTMILTDVTDTEHISTSNLSTKLAAIIQAKIPDILKGDMALYLCDFRNVVSVDFAPKCDASSRSFATKWLLQFNGIPKYELMETNGATYLHIAKWYVALWTDKLLPSTIKLLAEVSRCTRSDMEQILAKTDERLNQNTSNPSTSADEQNFSSIIPKSRILRGMYDNYTIADEISYHIVSVVCKMILPTSKYLHSCRGGSTWETQARTIVSIAKRVNNDSPMLHFLNLCIDLQNLMTALGSPDDIILDKIASTGLEIENAIESERTYLELCKVIQQFPQNTDILENFICIYFGRCIEVNPNVDLLQRFITDLIRKNSNELVSGARPVLFTIIRSDLCNFETFWDVVHCWTRSLSCENFVDMRCLDAINKYLCGCKLDCPLALVCCNVVEEIILEFLSSTSMVDLRRTKLPELLARTIKQDEHQCSMRLICAIAFIKAIIKVFVDAFEVCSLTDESFIDMAAVINDVIPVTASTDSRIQSVKHYFLRSMEKYKIRRETREKYQELLATKVINSMKSIEMTPAICSLGYNPLSYVEYYDDAERAHTEDISSRKTIFLQNTIENSKYRLAYLALIIQLVYLAETEQDDISKELRKWNSSEFTNGLQEFVRRLLKTSKTGPSDNWLQLSRSSSSEDIQLASVVMHIGAVIFSVSEQKSTAFVQYLRSSTSFSDLYLPTCGTASVNSYMSKNVTTILKCKCPCGQSTMLGTCQQEQPTGVKCSSCDCALHQWIAVDVSDIVPVIQGQDKRGYVYVHDENNCTDDLYFLGLRSLAPVTYRVIKILFNSLLFLGGCIKQKVKQHLIENLNKHIGHSTTVTKDNFITYLTTYLRKDWTILEEMLNLSSDELCCLLHVIIKETSGILTSNEYQSGKEDPENRNRLEHDLAQIVETQVQNMYHNMNEFKEKSVKRQAPVCKTALTNLLLRKGQSSFEDCRAQFFSSGLPFLKLHPFMLLIFRWCKRLSYLKYLTALVKWNSVISHLVRYRIDSNTARTKFHDDILYRDDYEPNEQRRRELRILFDDYVKAWNAICHGWKFLTGVDKEIPLMNRKSPIMWSLLTKREPECHLKHMIETLREIQNQFLNEVATVALTTTEDSCLDILKKGRSDIIVSIPWFSLNVMNTSRIIHFSKYDVCIIYHDNSISCNRYNFLQIEKKIVNDIIIHSAFLDSELLLENFDFTDDIFHSSSAILFEIEATIQQETLPTDVLKSFDLGHVSAPALLELLEIAIVFLKRIEGSPDDPLGDYISVWFSEHSLTNIQTLLRQNRKIKLKHVVDLYQKVEDVNFPEKIATLPKQYCRNMKDSSKKTLENKCMQNSLHLHTLQIIYDILKKFVGRYLRSVNIDPESGISSMLKSKQYRVVREMTEETVNAITCIFDDEILMSSVNDVVAIVSDAIKKRTANPLPPVSGRKTKQRGGKFR